MAVKRVLCRVELILSYIIRSIIRWHRLLNDVQTKNYLQVFFLFFFLFSFSSFLLLPPILYCTGAIS